MRTTTSLATRATTLLLLAAAAQQSLAQTDCPQIHVFGARETLVPSGFGSAGLVVQLIQDTFPGTTSEVIDYPAAGSTPDEYAASVASGIAAIVKQTTSFAAACPETQLVLVGYSQGSQIMDTAFCGGPDGTSFEEDVVPMPAAEGSKVAALIWMGNPRHVDGLPYNVGTAVDGGFAARPLGFVCNTYSNLIQSYCDKEDPFCSSGDDAEHHQQYGNIYGEDALKFVVSKLGDRGLQPDAGAATRVINQLQQAQVDSNSQQQVTVGLTANLTLPFTTMISGSPVTLTIPTRTTFPSTVSTNAGSSLRPALLASSAAILLALLSVF